MSKIFEPFFTTKPTNKGTGLGLSTVHGIVKQSEGHISVKSELGRGTTFELYFPALPTAIPELEQELPVRSSLTDGSEVILLVEDDHMVRDLSRRSLEVRGYMVLEAPDGLEALRIAEEYAGQIDLLLTDIVMPGMNGGELSYQIRRLRPKIRVLFMSGYAADALAERGVVEEITILQKPFPTEELVRRVREMLDMGAGLAH